MIGRDVSEIISVGKDVGGFIYGGKGTLNGTRSKQALLLKRYPVPPVLIGRRLGTCRSKGTPAFEVVAYLMDSFILCADWGAR